MIDIVRMKSKFNRNLEVKYVIMILGVSIEEDIEKLVRDRLIWQVEIYIYKSFLRDMKIK